MKPLPTDTMLLDGSGVIRFERKKPQAERWARQDMRENSPSGVIQWHKRNWSGAVVMYSVGVFGLINATIIGYFGWQTIKMLVG